MGDNSRVAEWMISLSPDASDIDKFISSFKGKLQSGFAELEKIAGQADLFKSLQDRLPQIKQALDENKLQASLFRAEIEKIQAAGGKVTDDLAKGFTATEKATAAAQRALNQTNGELSRVGTALNKAGFDTNSFAASQTKLATAIDITNAELSVQTAKGLLNVKTYSDVTPKINELNAAFNTLRTSGKLSATEIAAAEQALAKETAALNASVNALPTGFRNLEAGAGSALTSLSTKLLATVATFAFLTQAIKTVVTAGKDYENSLGEINAATSLSNAQLRELGDSARDIAVQFGTVLPDALSALKTILRGTDLGKDDALAALAVSAKTAEAAVTDVNAVAKIGTQIINAYKIPVGDLQASFDKLFAGSKAGGPELAKLGDEFGKLLVTARQSNIPFDVVVASLTSMTKATGDAGGAVGDLQKLILKFDTAQVQQGLRAAGVQATDFAGVMTELTARHLNINDFVDLGLASSKTGTAIASLTGSALPLPDALNAIANAAGAVEEGYQKMEHTPKEQLGQLWATVKDLFITLGDTGPTGAFVAGMTGVVKALDDYARNKEHIQEIVARSALETEAEAAGVTHSAEALEAYRKVAAALSGGNEDGIDRLFARTAAEASKMAAGLDEANIKIADAALKVKGLADVLQADVKALQDSSNAQIAAAIKAADVEIAQLDRSAAATAETARATAEIQAKLAGERLQIISENEATITKLTNEAIAAHEAALRKTSANETQIQGELAKLRLAAIQPTIAAYQSLYDSLLAQSQSYLGKEQALQQSRLSFNEGVEKTLFDIRIGGLSSFDQYLAKVTEVDRLISLERQAAAVGDTTNAQKYAQAAIQLAQSIGVAYSTNGTKIISEAQAVQTKIGKIKEAQDGVNESFDNADDAARTGYVLTQVYISRVQLALNELLATQKDLAKRAADGLNYKVTIDEETFNAARAKVNELTADRTIKVRIAYEQAPDFVGPPSPTSVTVPVQGNADGGYVQRAIQGFATGGLAFNRPTWNKVPGSGNGDTVPALLQSGSFVMRKAASQLYGDGYMGQLVRGLAPQRFASGGKVTDPYATQRVAKIGRETFGDPLLDRAYAATLLQINLLLDDLYGTQVPTSGTSMTKWLQLIAQGFRQFSIPHRQKVVEALDAGFDGWEGGIEAAKRFGVGVGVWPNFPTTFAANGLLDLIRQYAGGGAVGTDTVPSLLTPGEYVVNPAAVQKIERMFGGGFLPALNAMKMPADFNFDAPQPRRYATGGYVDGPGAPALAPMKASSGTGGGIRDIHIHTGRLTEQELNDTVLPWLNRKARASL